MVINYCYYCVRSYVAREGVGSVGGVAGGDTGAHHCSGKTLRGVFDLVWGGVRHAVRFWAKDYSS